jgi:hypothetical protein
LGARVEQALDGGREACLCIDERLGMANRVKRLDIERVCPVCTYKNLHCGPMVVVVMAMTLARAEGRRATNPQIF